jgi:molybdate transport system substrate-binding protein
MNTAAQTNARVLCTNGLKSVFAAIERELAARAGAPLAIEFGSTKAFSDRIAGGDVPDVALLSDVAIDGLIAQNKLAGRRIDVAKSYIGVAVRKGTRHPDISTPDAFIRMLRSAPSISRSKQGMSGLHMVDLLERLGLTNELAPKIKLYDGYAAQACAEGQVEIAIQQISELMPVAGLEIVGPLPGDLQKVTMFSAGLGAGTRHAKAGEALIDCVRAQADVLRANGLEPV